MIVLRPLVNGDAQGELVKLPRPLSLWGGLDPHTGRITESTHPAIGRELAGRILAMEEARGSSSSSSVLVEAARCGMAPAAILLVRPDPILTIGSLVAELLYGTTIPMALVSQDDWLELRDGAEATLIGSQLDLQT
jgi:predicted aconitase with swiveling domain